MGECKVSKLSHGQNYHEVHLPGGNLFKCINIWKRPEFYCIERSFSACQVYEKNANRRKLVPWMRPGLIYFEEHVFHVTENKHKNYPKITTRNSQVLFVTREWNNCSSRISTRSMYNCLMWYRTLRLTIELVHLLLHYCVARYFMTTDHSMCFITCTVIGLIL